MQHIAWAQSHEVWHHPLTQDFLAKECRCESTEFKKFRSWLSTKPRWSPFRVEWSIYNEDLKVAGQIDSIWVDLDQNGAYIMVDWKRSRQLLTDERDVIERQSFGQKGFGCCSHLYNIPFHHYMVQQTMYGYLLEAKYACIVRKMMLLQCHPHVCGAVFNEVPLCIDTELARSLVEELRTLKRPTICG